MHTSEIVAKSHSVKEVLEKIQNNKRVWEQYTKPTLGQMLNGVKDVTVLDWEISTPVPNQMRFVLKGEDQKEVAALLFTRTYKGLVSIDIMCYTADDTPNSRSEHFLNLAAVEPSALDHAVVNKSIEKLLSSVQDEYDPNPRNPGLSLQQVASFLP